MKEARIYAVKQGGAVVALVKAANKGQAIAHHARGVFEVAVASSAELIAATKSGLEVADATPIEPAPVAPPKPETEAAPEPVEG